MDYFSPTFAFLCVLSVTFSMGFSTRTVSLIFIVVGDNPGIGYRVAGPMFDVAFDRTRKQYPAIFRNVAGQILYKFTPDFSCGAASDLMYSFSGNLVSLIDQANTFPIIIAPGCSPEIVSLGDVARELDFPLIATTAADAVLDNRLRYPTLTSMSPIGIGGTTYAVRQFMRRYSWRIVTVLCDLMSKYPSAASSYTNLCNSMDGLFKANFGEFQVLREAFDSTDAEARNRGYYTEYLLRAKRQSRILLIITNPDVFKSFLINAHRLNMTEGEFVFLYPESIMVPGTKRLIDESTWKNLDQSDEMMLYRSFSCVIMFRLPLPDWISLKSFTETVAQRAKDHYNYTFSPDQYYNDVTLGIADTVAVIAQVLNESLSSMDIITGKTFSDRIAGRAFDVGYRKVTMLPNGDRYRDVSIHRFNPETKTFDAAWWHTVLNNSISGVTPSLAASWYGLPNLPPDKPLCGFLNELCSSSKTTGDTAIAVAVGVLSALIIAGLGGFLNRYRQLNDPWWMLNDGIGKARLESITRRPSTRGSFVRVI